MAIRNLEKSQIEEGRLYGLKNVQAVIETISMHIMAFTYICYNLHIDKCFEDVHEDMSTSTCEAGSNRIKRIPVKEPTWRSLHDLKEAGQSYDELLSVMILRERDYRDWKMITEIDQTGEFVAFDPDEIMQDE